MTCFGQHLPGLAVEQAAGADRHHVSAARGHLIGSRLQARSRACAPAPRHGVRPLRLPAPRPPSPARTRPTNANRCRFQRSCVSHRVTPPVLNSELFEPGCQSASGMAHPTPIRRGACGVDFLAAEACRTALRQPCASAVSVHSAIRAAAVLHWPPQEGGTLRRRRVHNKGGFTCVGKASPACSSRLAAMRDRSSRARPCMAQGNGKYFAPKDQVDRHQRRTSCSMRRPARMLEQSGRADQGRPHHRRRRRRADSGRRARDRSQRRHRDARHDRRPCAREHRRQTPSLAARACARWPTRRSISRPASPPCSTWIRAAASTPSTCATRSTAASCRARACRWSANRSISAPPTTIPTIQSVRYLRRLYREQERQRAVARARRRARSEAARRRLDQDLHHAGFRRHRCTCGSRTRRSSTAPR